MGERNENDEDPITVSKRPEDFTEAMPGTFPPLLLSDLYDTEPTIKQLSIYLNSFIDEGKHLDVIDYRSRQITVLNSSPESIIEMENRWNEIPSSEVIIMVNSNKSIKPKDLQFVLQVGLTLSKVEKFGNIWIYGSPTTTTHLESIAALGRYTSLMECIVDSLGPIDSFQVTEYDETQEH